MFRLNVLMLIAVAVLLAGPAWCAAQATTPTTQPEQAAVPATQPDETVAVAPTTQPDEADSPAQRTSQIGFLLTRNLPEHMKRRNREIVHRMPADERNRLRPYVGILQNANAELVQTISSRKSEFEQMAPERKDYYRQRAADIEEVLSRLSSNEKARLLAMPPKERAAKLLEMIAKLKAERARQIGTDSTNE